MSNSRNDRDFRHVAVELSGSDQTRSCIAPVVLTRHYCSGSHFELLHAGAPDAVRAWAQQLPQWLEVQPPRSIVPQPNLGAGEAQAISLAKELNAEVILIDERLGARVAAELGLFVVGTVGVLEAAAERELIHFASAIAELQKTSFRVAPSLVKAALERDTRRQRGQDTR